MTSRDNLTDYVNTNSGDCQESDEQGSRKWKNYDHIPSKDCESVEKTQ